ncbi:DegT/DnrJ/EryC1/StrS family aminotransferase [Miltoncostaea oceani]|jgi:dTDP-4-amino-4,6-dideoxygalactose transaminase|uniref:DegT/DnrJ/EryC1/StrS family aminotransferase n=1 Tax=Miltoncostaea oceani TaxID=2843216 RepID=UPI001C3D8A52|nr:DegT/DnrJ/EryC1/StrS family aminotransferase [Miltoncostaea oceani]
MAVPLMDIQAQYGPLRAELDAALAGVLDSGRFILGPEGRALEATVSERLDGRPCAGVANGTDALVIALNALDVGPGDEVITTPYTFYATAEAIARVGATPVFADIDPVTYCLDPAKVRERIGPRTKAILPVHIFGHPADMPAIMEIAREHGLVVVEDSAQAFGARTAEGEIGTFGDAATFSFFPTKNFPGMGDGGMVVCRDEALADRVKRLRFHGSKDKVVFEEVGYNSRLDDLQAAIIRVFYPHLDGWNAARAQAAAWYAEEGLGDVMALPATAEGARHIFHLYMARHPRRDDIRAGLAEAGVASAVYYGIPMHLQPVFAGLGYTAGDLPVAEEAAASALALPMHPNLTRDDVAEVVAAASLALERAGAASSP